jgi:hypothetical protein
MRTASLLAHRAAIFCALVSASICATPACGGDAAQKSSAPGPAEGPADASATPSSSGSTIPPALIALVVSLDVQNPKLEESARELEQTDHAEAKRLGSEQLVKAAKRVGRSEWRDERRREIESSLRQKGAVSSPAELDLAAIEAQTEAMRPIFAAMESLGGAAVATFALAEASDATLPIERRRMAIQVAARHLPSSDPRAASAATLRKDIDARAKNAASAGDAGEDAARVSRELTPAFKACFDKLMKDVPNASVKGTLEIAIGSDGAVTSVKLRNAPASLATCVEDAARKAKFGPPKAGRASFKLPLEFHTSG